MGRKRARPPPRDDDADERLLWSLEHVLADPNVPDDVKHRVWEHCAKTIDAGRVETYATKNLCMRVSLCVLAVTTSLRAMEDDDDDADDGEKDDGKKADEEARSAAMETCARSLESYAPAPVEVRRAGMVARMEWALGTIRGSDATGGTKGKGAKTTTRWKALERFWARWRSVEAQAENGALDAMTDDDEVKKTYEFVHKAAGNGGKLPSNWEKKVISREGVVELLETLCDDLKTKAGKSFLSRVDAVIDTEARGIVVNRGLIMRGAMSANAYESLLRTGQQAPPSPSSKAGTSKATVASPPKRVHIGVERKKSARTVEWESQNDDFAEPEEQSTPVRPPKASSKSVEPLAHLSWEEVSHRTPRRNFSSPAPGIVRKRTKWSYAEEQCLREGVERFGLGSWAIILRTQRDVFAQQRTSVDLKDKWRVMMQADARRQAAGHDDARRQAAGHDDAQRQVDESVQAEVDALAATIMSIRDASR